MRLKWSILCLILAGIVLMAACQPTALAPLEPTPTEEATATLTPEPSLTPTPAFTATPSPTPKPLVSPTPTYPPDGLGLTPFPVGINPLTGLTPAAASLLEKRPLVIKVENMPRSHRPQYGLSLADNVYEYYIEGGVTRFAAVFYGQDAEKVGPIRSGRLFDQHIVRMYRGILVFGSADPRVWNVLINSDFGRRLVIEGPSSCPALCRLDPKGDNILVANTAEMQNYVKVRAIDNKRQDQSGFFFKGSVPDGNGAQTATQLFARYSGSIYSRWDYDTETGRYWRYADAEDDYDNKKEVYARFTDRLTGKPVGAENVVFVFTQHNTISKDPEINDITLAGSGTGYAARDGKMYKIKWQRKAANAVLSLTFEDGTPYPLKPGQTWFVVEGKTSKVETKEGTWRFQFWMP